MTYVPSLMGGNLAAFLVNTTGTTQTISTVGTDTLVTWTTKVFDDKEYFNLGTNRFVPDVPGYYYVGANVAFSIDFYYIQVSLAKNGVIVNRSHGVPTSSGFSLSAQVYLNGSTDYVSVYVQKTNPGTANIVSAAHSCWFYGYRVGP